MWKDKKSIGFYVLSVGKLKGEGYGVDRGAC